MIQTVLLGDVVDISSSKRIFYSEYVKKGVPFYRSKEIIEKAAGNKNISTELFISEVRFNEIKAQNGAPEEGDLLLTSVGTLGVPYLVGKNEKFYFKDGNLTWFRNFNSKLDRKYLLYWLTSSVGKAELENHTIGSTQKALTIQGLKKIKIPLPEIKIQNRITDIIGSIDQKIELNRRMNETLEQIGQALFKHYFIDNPEAKTWPKESIYSIANVINGAPFSSKLFNEEAKGMPLIRIRDLKTQTPKIWTTEKHRNGRIIIPGDIIAGMDAEFRPIIWSRQPAWLNQRVCLFDPKSEKVSRLFLLETIKPQLAFYEETKIGTTVIHLSKTDIDRFTTLVPPNEIMLEFATLTNPIFELKVVNAMRLMNLGQLRDLLLPRLISGKIKI